MKRLMTQVLTIFENEYKVNIKMNMKETKTMK